MPSHPNAVLGEAGARQLLRRATFTPSPAEVAKFAGLTRAEAASRLLSYRPARFRPNNRDIYVAHGRWVKYMLRTKLQLQEKLVLFWHDHFATGNDKVQYPQAMSLQNRTLRRNAKGNLKDFVKAINVDPAMMEYLDTQRNRRSNPNENYARELLERFTMGVYDLNGVANYQQEDIVQIARALTGWRYDYKKLTPYLNGSYNGGQHDYMNVYPSRGPKELFGTQREDATGNVGGFASPQSFAPIAATSSSELGSEGAPEIDAVIEILFQHQDSDGANTVARYLAHRLLRYFCYDDPEKALVDEVIADSNFATDGHPNQWQIGELLAAIFVNDAFFETAATPPFGPSTRRSVRWPADYVVGTFRLLKLKTKGKYPYIDGANLDVWDQMSNMGQILLEPPSVFGWDWETSWISSTTLLARMVFARDVASARNGSGATAFRPEKLLSTGLTDAGQIVDAALASLAMTDRFTSAERDSLIDYLTDNDPGQPVDLTDEQVRHTKLHGLYGLILQSPHYQLQ